MKRKHIAVLSIAVFLILMAFSSPNARAQCRSFVKSVCLPQLTPFIHDGNYQAVKMCEGEDAEIYKTIFAGQKYRLLVCVDNILPNVEFIVTDIYQTILFDNRKNGNVVFWDFESEASQQIKITISIPKSKKKESDDQKTVFGCVGVLFGFMGK